MRIARVRLRELRLPLAEPFIISGGTMRERRSLVVVLEEARLRRLAFKVAIVIYLAAVLDMGINVLVSGVVGWRASFGG